MLYFLVMSDNRSPLRRYFREWGDSLHGRVRLLSYPRVRDPSVLRDAAYVFCDIERPWRLSSTTIDAMTDAEVVAALAHNRKGAALCGWKP